MLSRAERYGAVVGDLYPLAADTIAQARALLINHRAAARRDIGWHCLCGWGGVVGRSVSAHATHVVQVLAAAGLLASLAHLDEARPVDAPAPRPARRTTPFAASGGPRVFSDGGC